MSDNLTVALVAAGVVLLVAVLAQGVWQARRASPKKAEPGNSRLEPREPGMGEADTADAHDTVPGEPPEFDDPDGRVAPHLGEGSATLGGAVAGRSLRRRVLPRVDALIDVVVPLTLESPISGEAVLSHQPGSRRAGSKPFFIEGLNTDDGLWESPAPGQRYSELQAGLQLANRSGALNEIEYSEFVHKLQDFAEAVGAMADFPDMMDVAGRAASLTPSPATMTRRWCCCCAHARPPGAWAMCCSRPRTMDSCLACCPVGWCCRPTRTTRRRCSRSISIRKPRCRMTPAKPHCAS